MHLLLFDNYDSFTYNLYDYLLQLGVTCEVVRNDSLTEPELQRLDFDAIVLSPGPRRPRDAGRLMWLIEHFYTTKPMLGVCLGHQALGEFFGARLVRAPEPVHGKTSVLQHDGAHPLFAGMPTTFEVMRYHSLVLESLEGTPLDCLATTSDGQVMALAHRHLPLTGVQFHPESILTEHGLQLLRNWLQMVSSGTRIERV